MSEIPPWWLYLSGAFFFVNLVLFAVLAWALVARILPMMQSLSQKIEGVATKVEGVAHKVDELAVSAKATLENVGGRAKSVAGSADLIAHSASKQFEKFSPLIVGALTALRLLKAVQEYRRGKTVAAATTQAATEPRESIREQRRVDRKLAKRDN